MQENKDIIPLHLLLLRASVLVTYSYRGDIKTEAFPSVNHFEVYRTFKLPNGSKILKIEINNDED